MEPTDNIENYKFGVFYFNKYDNRIVVPKNIKWLGWTLNFGHFASYVLVALIIAIPVIIGLLK